MFIAEDLTVDVAVDDDGNEYIMSTWAMDNFDNIEVTTGYIWNIKFAVRIYPKGTDRYLLSIHFLFYCVIQFQHHNAGGRHVVWEQVAQLIGVGLEIFSFNTASAYPTVMGTWWTRIVTE